MANPASAPPPARPFWRRAQLPPCSSTKEIEHFGSDTLRWIWQFYTWRLTQAGRWFVWPTIGFVAYTSMSLLYQSYIGFSYVAALWVCAVAVAIVLRPRARLEVRHDGRACAGETLPVEISVEPLGWWRRAELYVQAHRLPAAVDVVNEDGVAVPATNLGGARRLTLGLRCQKRGAHLLKAFRVETDFPFGLIRSYRVFPHERPLLIDPRFTPLTRLEVPVGRRYQPGGVALASVTGDSVEFVGDRDYHDGDNLRDMDWMATAAARTFEGRNGERYVELKAGLLKQLAK